MLKFLSKVYSKIVSTIIVLILKLFGNKYEKKLINKVQPNILLRNFYFQRVLGINNKCKYSINYTSRASFNTENFIIENDSITVLISLAISGNCYYAVHADTKVLVGENTIFAPCICINTANHDLTNRKIYHKGDIVLGKNNWLSFGVVITKGVQLGDNVTVAANSVVNKNFGNNVVIGGLPARVIKEITEVGITR